MSEDDFEPAKAPPSLQFAFHGSLVTCTPTTPEARTWLETHTDPDNVTWYGGALVIEGRYLDPFVEAAQEDGFTCGADA